MTVLSELGEALAALDSGALSSESRDALRVHVADTVCATIMGSGTPDGQAVLAFRSDGGVAGLSAGALDDVALRCAITRLSEIDDIHLPSGTTPGAIVVPAALALSAHLGTAKAADVANAILAGYEAMARFGAAADGQSLIYRGIWTTYFAAPFGTAAVAARLLGLDGPQTANALGIALTGLSGRMGQPGTGKTSRWLMAGYAARAGCFAAVAAANGFDGDVNLLDGPWMETAHGVAVNRDAFLADAPGGSVVPQISIKPYCSAKQMIAAICGFEEILGRGIDPDAIDRVVVAVPPNYAKMIDHGVSPGNRLSSLTSAQHQLALTAYHRNCLYDVARETFVLTPPIEALMAKVSVEIDESLGRHLPARWPARVDVTVGGRHETVEVVDALGDPPRPFDLDKIREKFHGFADDKIGTAAADVWLTAAIDSVTDDTALADLQSRYLAIGIDG